MKTIFSKKVIFLIVFYFTFLNLNAQLAGFGNGTVESDPNISTGIHYLDDVNAEITGVVGSTATTLCITISSAYKSGNFATGDMALLIQMKGGTIGRHQNVYVISNNCSPSADLKLEAIGPIGTPSMLSYSVGSSGENLQLIKIHRYNDFTLSGGIITCRPYNGHTGGVLPILVDGDFDISGGLISVDGKGYTVSDAACNFALGGAGASVGTSTVPASSAGAPNQTNFDGGAGCSTINLIYVGSNGGQGNNTGGSAVANSGSTTGFGGSNYYTNLVMGDPGFWQSGYGSGKGSGGGGLGGNGGNNTVCSNNGYAGISGSPGGPGGAAGKGGRGGGALLIKALNVNLTTNNIVFTARGGNGTNGGNGSNGGVGGLGGPGGEGCCPSNAMDAGPGGNGDYGEGADGGDGGNGGRSGFIWIVCMQNYSFTATNNNMNFDVTGGGVGIGGIGGWGGGNGTYSITSMDNRCTGDECTSSGTGCLYLCDVDYAMCFLAANATSAGAAGSTDTKFYAGSNEIGRYFASDSRLEILDGCDKYVSYWTGSPKSATDMFKHFRSIAPVPTTVGYYMDYTANSPSTVGCGSSSYPKHIDFFEAGGEVILSFHHDAIASAAEINEAESFNSIYADDCHTFSGTQKGSGRNGIAGPNGVFTTQTSNTDNIIITVNALWKKSKVSSVVKSEQLEFSFYPNPSSKNVWIDFPSDQSDNLTINLFDITGKVALLKNEIIQKGTNKFPLDVSELKSGIYYLNIISGTRTETAIIKVQ